MIINLKSFEENCMKDFLEDMLERWISCSVNLTIQYYKYNDVPKPILVLYEKEFYVIPICRNWFKSLKISIDGQIIELIESEIEEKRRSDVKIENYMKYFGMHYTEYPID